MRGVALLLLGLCACAGATEIDLSDYDRSCSVDDDCALVGNIACGVCGCADEAIATSEVSRLDDELAAVMCAPQLGPQPLCGPCEPWFATCEDGTCVAGPEVVADAGP